MLNELEQNYSCKHKIIFKRHVIKIFFSWVLVFVVPSMNIKKKKKADEWWVVASNQIGTEYFNVKICRIQLHQTYENILWW